MSGPRVKQPAGLETVAPVPDNATPMSHQEFEAYINKIELARRIGRTVRTVDSWMASGWIPFYKIGRTVAFKWSEVDAHLQAHFKVCLRGGK